MYSFIGDVHGKWNSLNQKIYKVRKSKSIIQVGDFGIGFGINVNKDELPDNFYFLPGNHDFQDECKEYPNYLGMYGYSKDLNLFFVGGAESIDKYRRTEGIDWWRNEQVSYSQTEEILDLYYETKPSLVATHDCPIEQRVLCLPKVSYESNNSSFTVMLLNELMKIHKPRVWVHGHLHVQMINQIDNTLFIGLKELGTISLDEDLNIIQTPNIELE